MQIYDGITETKEFLKGCYVALGNFDGVHIGHQSLIQRCIKEASIEQTLSVVYTFSPHPEELFSPDSFGGYLTSRTMKERILRELGIDILVYQSFNPSFARTSPETFITDYLVRYLEPKKIFVGFNFCFGNCGKGSPELLLSFGEKHNFSVHVEKPVIHNNEPISSSRIRRCIETGDFIQAKSMLGYWPEIEGRVMPGRQLGRKLGYPTANISIADNLIVPATGVYATQTIVEGVLYPSLTNIGFNPTFASKSFSIETYIIDYSEDLYGEMIRIAFLEKIREEIKFSSVESLILQIENDIRSAEKIRKKHAIFS